MWSIRWTMRASGGWDPVRVVSAAWSALIACAVLPPARTAVFAALAFSVAIFSHRWNSDPDIDQHLVRVVEVPEAGHCIRRDNPAGFHAVVDPFLESAR